MRRQRRGVKLFCLLFTFVLFAAACSSDKKSTGAGSSSSGPAQKKGGTLILGAEQWPDCLNPITQCANSSWMHWAVAGHVMPRLMELDEKGNFVPSPVLAGDPKLSGEGTSSGTGKFTIVYNIDPNAVWDDGSPMTADDLIFSLDAYLKTTGAVSTAGYDKIEKIESSNGGKTATFTFSVPYADWQDLFGGNQGYFYKKAAFAGPDTKADMIDSYTFSGGPFKLDSFDATQATFSPNAKYWDKDRTPFVDKVIFKPLADSDTELNAVKAGEVFAIYPQASPGIKDQVAQPDLKLEFAPGVSYEALYMDQNSLQNPDTVFNDKTVREAVMFAVDRQAILDQIIHPDFPDVQLLQCGVWVPTVGQWCDQTLWADVKFDPAKVKSLLEGDGWAKGADGIYAKAGKRLSFKWTINAGNKRRESIQALVIPKLKDLGIEAVPDNTDADTLFQTRLPQRQLEMGTYIQTASPDPSVTTILSCKQIPSPENSFSGQNSVAWCNQQASDLMDQSDKTPDPAKRLDLIHQIGKLLRQDAVLLPFYQLPNVTIVRTDKIEGPTTLYTPASYSAFGNIYDWSLK
ncbi:MAG: peptide/nickel transport system substrate-binding protein [Acidimicrobiaceae bacterium]